MGNTYTNKYKLLHNRILEHNDIDPMKLNAEELASLPEECVIKLYNKYPIREYNYIHDYKIKETLNITPFVLQNCPELARLSIIRHHIDKYPEIICLDIDFIKDGRHIIPSELARDFYFKCPNFPWNHLETYRKYPEWFEDKNKF